ncbi:MAG: hypothetical protein IKA81_06160 [Alistipes sp.]|nr:hypothetical protein [Alistipes sp.]
MKRSGRTLKQRLFGLKHLHTHIGRIRHFRGHGVHSPYVYDVVRQVLMHSTFINDDHTLYDTLIERGYAHKRALQLQNLAAHCQYSVWSIDSIAADSDYIILTENTNTAEFARYYNEARSLGATLCILSPYLNAERLHSCREFIECHPSTTIDNRGYLLFFNNHLPRQQYRL